MKNDELRRLIDESVATFKALSRGQQETMLQAQRDSYVRAEMNWPKSKYHWEIRDGVKTKVYDSYEDYCNG